MFTLFCIFSYLQIPGFIGRGPVFALYSAGICASAPAAGGVASLVEPAASVAFSRRLRPVRPQWDSCPPPYPLPCRFPSLLCRGGCGQVSNPPEHSRRYPASVTASDSVFSSVSAPASYSVSVPACVPAFVSVSDSVFVPASVSASVPASVPPPASVPAPALPSSASTSTISPSTSRAIV